MKCSNSERRDCSIVQKNQSLVRDKGLTEQQVIALHYSDRELPIVCEICGGRFRKENNSHIDISLDKPKDKTNMAGNVR
jgi:hypothetical protein